MSNPTNPTNRTIHSGAPFSEADATIAIAQIARLKGKERAALIEKMMRNETSHFKSKQFIATGSAGMEEGAWGKVLKPYFPNGYRLAYFKDNQPAKRGTSKPLGFIIWPSVYQFMLFLSDYIDRHNGNWARWNSTDAKRQAEYRKHVGSTKSRITDGLKNLVHAVEHQIDQSADAVKDFAHKNPKGTAGIGAGIIIGLTLIGLFLFKSNQ